MIKIAMELVKFGESGHRGIERDADLSGGDTGAWSGSPLPPPPQSPP